MKIEGKRKQVSWKGEEKDVGKTGLTKNRREIWEGMKKEEESRRQKGEARDCERMGWRNKKLERSKEKKDRKKITNWR
jgi:hypothetical protein